MTVASKKHVAIYVRVSSQTQDTRSQEAELRRWAASQDAEIVWYRDKASGKTMDRPGWQKLWADVEAGRVSRIVVWRLDRLGRTASGLSQLFDALVARRIGLLSLRDSIDLQTAAGRLMANVLASVAVYENEVRSERIRAGQAAARARGTRWGGSPRGRRLSVTEEQVCTIKRLRADGERITAIARATGLSRPTIYSVLREKQVAG